MKIDVLIVGSGLSAFGALSALIDNPEINIHLIDIGLTEPVEGQSNRNIPNSKPVNKSFFIYGLNDQKRWPFELRSKRICSSHAKGGFAKAYSGSILAPQYEDLSKWPDLACPKPADYADISRQLYIQCDDDQLAEKFPLIPLARDLEINNHDKNSTCVGTSRIGFNSSGQLDKPFDPFIQIEEWIMQKKIIFHDCEFVYKLGSFGNSVIAYSKSCSGFKERQFDYVFLGAGCINTTAIVHRSLYGLQRQEYTLVSAPILLQLHLKVSKSILFDKNSNRNFSEHSDLCQVFLEHKSAATGHLWSHTQLNYLNSTIIDMVKLYLPKSLFFIIMPLIRRFFVFSITAFHSDCGPSTSVIIDSSSDQITRNQALRVSVDEHDHVCTSAFVRALNKAIYSKFSKLKLIPIPFSRFIADYIRGNRLGGWHFGGTLPMQSAPNALHNCHIDGSLKGLSQVYIIDSSGFPSVPGSSVAFLTMANAYRIAKSFIQSHLTDKK